MPETFPSFRLSRPLVAACFSLMLWPSAAVAELTIQGFTSLRGAEVESQPSWREGGFGRFPLGAGDAGDSSDHATGQLHLAFDWRPTRHFGAYFHTVVRAEPGRTDGRAAGVIEGYLHSELDLGASSTLRLKLGHFILPTSRENVEFAWSSPYTLTFSALNTWIGEEMRLTGLLGEVAYALPPTGVDELRFGGTVFGGNDSAGALLAWRGWALGDRLTVFDEIVPLPPVDSLGPGGAFEVQLDDGTQPFGSDLDDRAGWAGYARWQREGVVGVQWTHYDNRGDRLLHNGDEYAWATRLDILGFDFHRGAFSLLGEALDGSTGMGDLRGPHVQVDLETAYLLVSWAPRRLRVSLRYDTFETTDVDRSGADRNDEDGEVWTAAFFWEPRADLRLGVELVDLDARRPAALDAGADPDTGGRSVLLELRYYFDF